MLYAQYVVGHPIRFGPYPDRGVRERACSPGFREEFISETGQAHSAYQSPLDLRCLRRLGFALHDPRSHLHECGYEISFRPMLYDLAVYHLIDVDARQSDPSAAGPQSEPFVLMDAGSAHTRDDGVALGDLVLDGYVEIAVSVVHGL